ncbi:hypothetical protein TNIN_271631 [Trichonephila inaurata madagascariensis]|uniref:Uncharacterized protein n=1 Tax=Trichonephila inaurata madagascariensis TaxID=2747483 RepID=A0A8X6XUK7_9ARAC|nr:hypothetical protein TNIN_271631 [Trichonephila inaurata madagascariensis]
MPKLQFGSLLNAAWGTQHAFAISDASRKDTAVASTSGAWDIPTKACASTGIAKGSGLSPSRNLVENIPRLDQSQGLRSNELGERRSEQGKNTILTGNQGDRREQNENKHKRTRGSKESLVGLHNKQKNKARGGTDHQGPLDRKGRGIEDPKREMNK